MKKLLTYIFLALSLVTLAACGKNEAAKLTSSTNNHQSKVQGQVTLILKTDKESKKKSVEIQKGDTVLDVLEEVYPVQENDGFITLIIVENTNVYDFTDDVLTFDLLDFKSDKTIIDQNAVAWFDIFI